MRTGQTRSPRIRRPRFRPAVERLEHRAVPTTATWSNFAANPQHTGVSPYAAGNIDTIVWQTPIDLNPTGAFVHYGAPVITAHDTILVPVKTGAFSGFEVNAFNATTGQPLWSIPSDYTLPPWSWMPPFGPALSPSGRLYFPGNGGTVYFVDHPDDPGATVSGQLAFYGLKKYQANPGFYNAALQIDTPITADNAGNIYFGFELNEPNPRDQPSGGIARIDANGNGTYVLAGKAANDPNITKVALSAAPALSNDGKTLYVPVNNGNNDYGYLLALDSTTLATKDSVLLKDPRFGNANNAAILDISTATPMVAPDGTVFYGVFGNPYNGSRGFLLHFSADLQTEYTPGAFGWDDTPSIVPTSMVPEYHGTSPYLIFSKYNNYVAAETGSTGGDGYNEVAILDPYASQPDVRNDGDPNLQVMNEVLTMAGPTPDTFFVNFGFPNARREWCINDTAVDPATKSILLNSEDGNVYRWSIPSDTLTQAVNVTGGVGEPYVPTIIGPSGLVYALNGGTLFALGAPQNYRISLTTSVNPARANQPITFYTSLTSTSHGPVPIGTVTYEDNGNPLMTVNVVNGSAVLRVDSLPVGPHIITAVYSGDSHYAASSAELVETVGYGNTTDVTSSPNPSTTNQPVTFTATVTPVTPGSGTPTGKVVFLDGKTLLGTAWLVNGQATLTVSNLTAGSHSITAVYDGDINFVPTTSKVLHQTVNATGVSTSNPALVGRRLRPSGSGWGPDEHLRGQEEVS
jgi:hypothetical protein